LLHSEICVNFNQIKLCINVENGHRLYLTRPILIF
jgi:hypothetical protein